MQLSSIVQVLLRLSSINWFVSGIFQLVYSLASTRSQAFSVGHVLAPMVLIISAIICWLFAPFLARIVSKGSDTSVSIERLSLFSLYSTAFVCLGLWFALANFAQVFNWLHFYISYPKGMSDSGPGSFYKLSQAGLTFLAGVILVASSQTWARKLTKGCEQNEAPPPCRVNR